MTSITSYVIAAIAAMTFLSCGGKDTPIRFANYNMRVIMSADSLDRDFYQRKPFILKRIADYDFDIIGAQEVNDEMKEALAEDLKDTYSVFGEGRREDRKGEGTPIFYKTDRFELLDWGSFWLSETPDVPGSKNWDASVTRIATWSKFLDKKTKKKSSEEEEDEFNSSGFGNDAYSGNKYRDYQDSKSGRNTPRGGKSISR